MTVDVTNEALKQESKEANYIRASTRASTQLEIAISKLFTELPTIKATCLYDYDSNLIKLESNTGFISFFQNYLRNYNQQETKPNESPSAMPWPLGSHKTT